MMLRPRSIGLVSLLAASMSSCDVGQATPSAPEIYAPALAHVAGHPVMFGLAGVLEGSATGVWADGTPWTAVVSFDPLSIVEGFKYTPVEWTFEIDGETIYTANAALNVEPDVLEPGDSYQPVDEGNGLNGTLKGSVVAGLAINFQDHDANQLGPGFDVTRPLDLAEWEVHNGTIDLADVPGTTEIFEVQCFGVYRAPLVAPGRPDEPGPPDRAGRPCVTSGS